jgi:hypothetical protein
MNYRKSRKSGVKHKRRGVTHSHKKLQRHQSLTLSPKQASVTKSPVTMAEQPVRYPYVLSELRRSLVIAGLLFVLLIGLSLFLR